MSRSTSDKFPERDGCIDCRTSSSIATKQVRPSDNSVPRIRYLAIAKYKHAAIRPLEGHKLKSTSRHGLEEGEVLLKLINETPSILG